MRLLAPRRPYSPWSEDNCALVVGLMILVAANGGCANYAPLPLPDNPDLHSSLPLLDSQSLRLARQSRYASDAVQPLTMMDVAIFAVLENPQLKAQRLKHGISGAQLFSAGLLPDPQLGLSVSPVVGGPGTQTGWLYGLNYDLQALVLHRTKVAVASAAADKIDLETLWQEWQVVQQARTLFVTLAMGERKLELLREHERLAQERFDKANKALAARSVTIETAGPDLTMLLDVRSQVALLERAIEDARLGLTALLGLQPNVFVPIMRLEAPRPITRAAVERQMDTITNRRPDLLALQAGYQAQEGQLRQAVLAQFPSVIVGLSHASDTTGVQMVNLGVTLGLPLFNGNRGEIAVQTATREQLRQEYQARIDQTVSDVHSLVRRQELLDRQIFALKQAEPMLADMAKQARAAYATGEISSLVFLNLETSLLQKQRERLDLEEALWTTRIALETLLGYSDRDVTAVGR